MEEAIGPPTEIWPDNDLAVSTFLSMSTQWRSGGFGATGLDYTALESVMRMTGVPRKEWADVFHGVGVMESEALKLMRKEK